MINLPGLRSTTACAAALVIALCAPASSSALAPLPADNTGGLLRNGDFQDDWTTHLPELKNHHWNYTTDVYNRRDYNPDGWWLSGAWDWVDADKPAGQRKVVLRSPGASVTQNVNWVTIHNSKKRPVGWPDAGGFPPEENRRTKNPLGLVRDLKFTVTVNAKDVPENAGEIIVAFDKTVSASAPIPAGSGQRVIEVTLKAEDWLAKAKADKQAEALGVELPAWVHCTIRFKAPQGTIEIQEARLDAAAQTIKDLAVNGGFEELDADGYPKGWGKPDKYIYFAPGLYYNFNTWHNTTALNRGPVGVDSLVRHGGRSSLKMIVASGDEKFIASPTIELNQTEPRLIEASVWVKTDHLSSLQLDAEDETGKRIDGYNFIQKYPLSVGTNNWRLVRQVFSPTAPVKTIRIRLAARGVNGYTLDDTSQQPQNNVSGTVWWDDLQVYEPERADQPRAAASAVSDFTTPLLMNLDLGERMFGENELSAMIYAGGAAGSYKLVFDFTSPTGVKAHHETAAAKLDKTGAMTVKLRYPLTELCANAYTEYRGAVTLLRDDKPVASSDVWFSTWTVPIDLELGELYMQPEHAKQFVKLNLGLSYAAMKNAKAAKLEVIRRATGKVESTLEIPATLESIAAQREKIPNETRDDFANELLADVDVTALPVQPFNDPQRNWFVRATVIDAAGKPIASVDSQPFCRLAKDAKQPPVQSVRIDNDGLMYVNDQPWLAWGVTYGHNPVYAGPADSGKYHNLRNVSPWGLYDRHGGALGSRKIADGNCNRFVAGSITKLDAVNGAFQGDNIYASSVFVVPGPVWSLEQLAKSAGGKDKLDAYLAGVKASPAVISTAPGIEEAFGNFTNASKEELSGMEQVVQAIREVTGKPVMVGHGGYWNRFEFERVPYYDIFDPETEPLYPAHLHTDMRPIIEGKPKVAWLRPQMYEDVPYERWRFHVFIEMMRGCRGWQLAHGPGDATTYRGLHGEVEWIKPILYSKAAPPKVTITPQVENMVRKHDGKTYVVAATSHGMTFGTWRWADEPAQVDGKAFSVRVTDRNHEWRDDANGYNVTGAAEQGPRVHGLQYLVHQRKWSAGSKVVQWIKIDAANAPKNLLAVLKADGRWTHAASWAGFDTASLRSDPAKAHWFGRTLYRHITGVIGFGNSMSPAALELVPNASADMGALPAAGAWIKLEIPLDKLNATDKLIDGVGFLHENGTVQWGPTTLVAPDGTEQVVMGDHLDRPSPESLAKTRFAVEGLKKGAKVRVVFEDRDIIAEDGAFTDDLRGQDLYQRFGGVDAGYGNAPVTLKIYEIPAP